MPALSVLAGLLIEAGHVMSSWGLLLPVPIYLIVC